MKEIGLLSIWNSIFELIYSLFLERSCREADERRQMMLSQILSSQARERSKPPSKCFGVHLVALPCFFVIVIDMMIFQSSRETQCFVNVSLMLLLLLFFSIVARIALVKPEKARGVEDVILRAAQMGQIVEKVRVQSLFHVIVQNLTYHLVSTQVSADTTRVLRI